MDKKSVFTASMARFEKRTAMVLMNVLRKDRTTLARGCHFRKWHPRFLLLKICIKKRDATLQVVAVGNEITESEIVEAKKNMRQYGLDDMELLVIQAANDETFALAMSQLSDAEQTNAVISTQLGDLQRQLAVHAAFDTLTVHITALPRRPLCGIAAPS